MTGVDPRVALALMTAAKAQGMVRQDLSSVVGFPFEQWRKGTSTRAWSSQGGWSAYAPHQRDTDPSASTQFPSEAEALAHALGIGPEMLHPEVLDAILRHRKETP